MKNYNANASLKAANVTVNFTEDQIREYIKCSADPVYFIKSYCKIISLDGGLIPFELFEYQSKFIYAIHTNNRIVSMQPRQMGKSQTVAAYILYYTLFNPYKTAAILANKSSAAREIMSRYQLMYEQLPMWLQQGVVTWNKGDVELENGAKVFTAATSGSGIRGKSVNLLYVDETAIIPNNVAEDFFTSTYPTISSGKTTKVVLTSTPLGYNHFWNFWQGAEHGTNGFTAVRVNYWDHPDRDEAWAQKQRQLLGDIKFTQEILCEFLGSSLTLINADAFGRMVPRRFIHSKDGLDILDAPQSDHLYMLIADTAKGVGGDYSAFVVVDITTVPYKVVAKYRDNHISPMLYPNVIRKVASEYNEAFVLIEINSSEQVAIILRDDLEYENVLTVYRNQRGQVISEGFGGGNTQSGVVTDKKVKRIGCTALKALVEENKLIVQDPDIISEISVFIEKNGSYQADEGYHDDLVMPLVLFGWVTTNVYFKDISNVNLRQAMYQARIDQIESDMTPIGWVTTGAESDQIVNF